MIVEIADFAIAPDQREAFGRAITEGVETVLSKSEGYRAHRILRSQESPGRVVLMVEWDTLESHTVGFRQSPAFAQWRALIGPFFQQPPQVEHFDTISASTA